MIDIREKKVFVATEEQSKRAQEKLFELGCEWSAGNKIQQKTEEKFLYIDENKKIKWSDYKKEYFDKHKNKEIYFDDLMKMEVEEMTNKEKIDLLFERINIIEGKLK